MRWHILWDEMSCGWSALLEFGVKLTLGDGEMDPEENQVVPHAQPADEGGNGGN